jgi:hypothetical protein
LDITAVGTDHPLRSLVELTHSFDAFSISFEVLDCRIVVINLKILVLNVPIPVGKRGFADNLNFIGSKYFHTSRPDQIYCLHFVDAVFLHLVFHFQHQFLIIGLVFSAQLPSLGRAVFGLL